MLIKKLCYVKILATVTSAYKALSWNEFLEGTDGKLNLDFFFQVETFFLWDWVLQCSQPSFFSLMVTQTYQPKTCKSWRLWIFLYKDTRNFSLNSKMLESRKKIGAQDIFVKVQIVNGNFLSICCLIPVYILLTIYYFVRILRILYRMGIDV